MRDITTIEDQMRDHVVIEYHEGGRVVLDRKAVQLYGLRALLRDLIGDYKAKLLPVYQRGRNVGTLSEFWHPSDVPRSLMYEPRPNDFRREGDTWIADPMLGPGDLLHAGVNMINKPEW